MASPLYPTFPQIPDYAAARQREKDHEEMFLSPQLYLARMTPEQRAPLDAWLSWSPDPDADTRKSIARGYVGDYYELPDEALANGGYETYRDRYAREVLGVPYMGAVNDESFFNLVKGKQEKARETRVQAEAFASAGMAAALKLNPADPLQEMAALDENAGKIDGMDEKDAARFKESYRSARESIEKAVGPYRQTARTIAGLLKVDAGRDPRGTSDMDMGYDPKTKALDLLTDLPPEGREHVVRLIASEVAGDNTGTAGKQGESFIRGLATQLRGAASSDRRRSILALQKNIEAGSVDFPDGATPEAAFRKLTGTNAIEQDLNKLMGDTRPATEKETAALKEMADRELERNIAAGQISTLLDTAIDPLKARNYLEKIALNTSGSLGMMAPIMIPYAGVVIAQGGYADQEFQRQISMGTDPATASRAADVTGAIQAGVERASFLFNFAPSSWAGRLSPKFTTPGLAASGTAQVLGKMGTIQAAEYTEEIIQDATPALTAAIAENAGWSLPEKARFEEESKRWKLWNPETFLTVAALSMFGGGAQGIANTAEARARLTQQAGSPVEMTALGVPPEAAERIAALPEMERLEAFRAEYKNRNAESPEAEKARKTITDRDAAARAQGQREIRQLGEAGISITRTTDGYQVTDTTDGTGVLHATADEAMVTARKVMLERGLQKEDTFLDALGEFAGQMREGRTLEVTNRSGSLLNELLTSEAEGNEKGMLDVWDRADQYRASIGEEALKRDMNDPDSRNALEGLIVLGKSKTTMQENAARSISLIMRGGATLDLVEEQAENDLREAVAGGRVSMDTMKAAIEKIETATGDKYLFAGNVTEAWSKIVRLFATGTKKEGNKVTAGARAETAASVRQERRRLREAESQGVAPGVFAKLREYYDQTRAMLGMVARLMKAKSEGKLDDIEEMIRESVGLKPQDDFEAGVEEQARETYDPPGDTSFSLSDRLDLNAARLRLQSAKKRPKSNPVESPREVVNPEQGSTPVPDQLRSLGELPGDEIAAIQKVYNAVYSRDASLGESAAAIRADLDSVLGGAMVDRLLAMRPEPRPAAPSVSSPVATEGTADDARIRTAYVGLVARNGSDSVFISDLAEASGTSVPAMREWIQDRVIEKGLGSLNEGDWSYANAAQREAMVMHRDRKRLYVRLHDQGGSSFSIAPARDSEYMAAAEAGDTAAAQKMVDEAAKAAGYNAGPFYHGTPSKDFARFDRRRMGDRDFGYLGKGFYFTSSEKAARYYAGDGGSIIRAFVRAYNTLPVSHKDSVVKHDFTKTRALGYDSIEFTGIDDSAHEFVVFNPEDIKSADPVTRDTEGNVIPLSQRFDRSRDEISYAITTADRLNRLAGELGKRAKNPEIRRKMFETGRGTLRAVARAVRANDLAYAETGENMQRRNMLRFMQALDTALAPFPAEVRGKVGGFTKLASLDTDRKMETFIRKRIEKLDQVFETFLRKEYRDEVRKILDKSEVRVGDSRIPKGKLTPETQRALDLARKYAELSTTEAESEMAGVEGKRAAAKDQAELDRITDDSIILHFMGGALDEGKGGMTSRDLASAAAWLQDTYAKGKTGYAVLAEEKKAQRDGWIAAIVAKLGKATADQALDRVNRDSRAGHSAIQTGEQMIDALNNIHQQLADILGPDHEVTRKFSRDIRQNRLAARLEQHAESMALFEWVKTKLGAKSEAAATILISKLSRQVKSPVSRLEGRKVTTDEISIDLAEKIASGTVKDDRYPLASSQAKALGESLREYNDALAAHDAKPEPRGRRPERKYLEIERVTDPGVSTLRTMSMMEAVNDTLLWQQERYKEANMERHGLGEDYINQVEAWLSPEAKSIREFLRERYGSEYPGMNKTFRELFNINMPQEDNYARASFVTPGMTAEPVGPDGLPISQGGSSIGSIKGRVAHKAEPKRQNALALRMSHVAQISHWKASAVTAQNLRSIFSPLEVKNAIVVKHGQPTYDRLMTAIKVFESGGWRDAMANLDGHEAMQRLMGTGVANSLAYNIGSIMAQTPAAVVAMTKVGPAAWSKAAAKLAANPGLIAEIYQDPALILRRGPVFSRGQIFSMLSGRDGNIVAQNIMRAGEFGTELLGVADAGLTSISGAVAYLAHLAEASKVMGPTEAKIEALDRMRETIEETAQPDDFTRKSNFENQVSGSKGLVAASLRALFMFKGAARAASANIFTTLKQAARSEITPAQAAGRITALLVFVPLLEQAMRSLFRDMTSDDPDEKLWSSPSTWIAAMLSAPLTGMPGIGSLQDAAKVHFLGGFAVTVQDPGSKLATEAMKATAQMLKGDEVKMDINAFNAALHATAFGLSAAGLQGGAALEGILNLAKAGGGVVDNFQASDDEKGEKFEGDQAIKAAAKIEKAKDKAELDAMPADKRKAKEEADEKKKERARREKVEKAKKTVDDARKS